MKIHTPWQQFKFHIRELRRNTFRISIFCDGNKDILLNCFLNTIYRKCILPVSTHVIFSDKVRMHVEWLLQKESPHVFAPAPSCIYNGFFYVCVFLTCSVFNNYQISNHRFEDFHSFEIHCMLKFLTIISNYW